MHHRIAAPVLLAALFLAAAPAGAAQSDATAQPGAAAPADFTPAERGAILDGAAKAIGNYTFPEKIPALRAELAANRVAYLQIEDPKAFAKAVSDGLYAVAHDKHLRVNYLPFAQAAKAGQPDAGMAHYMQMLELKNYGYVAALRLAGNVGYVKLDGFGPMPQSKAAIDAAMTMMAHTDALVIDVRGNHGGDPDSLDYLMGYFYAKPVELTSILMTDGTKSQLFKQFSEANVAGPRYLNKPLYVLISDHTFSCAEQFAYDMKSLHRATLFGKTTGGGANPGGFVPLDDHFAIFIPRGRAINPYTKTNWEGVGVAPDVPTEPEGALLAAYTQALGAAKDSFDEVAASRAEALKDPAKALQASLPSP
jgi:retinol-binding protein 3